MTTGSRSIDLTNPGENCQAIGTAEPLTSLATASRSSVALANIERSVAAHESWFGRERLLRLIAGVPEEHVVGHVAFYRDIVRTGNWPNEPIASPIAPFIDDFERAAAVYVRAAFKALAFVDNGKPQDLAETAHLVAASEALRGQYGKRSPTGLDARLDEYERELEGLLSALPNPSATLELLCTPTDPHLSAESMLLEDLAQMQAAFPNPPSEKDLVHEVSDRTEVAWVFLRRHARWSLAQVRGWYRELNGDVLLGLLRKAREERCRIADARHEALGRLSSTFGATIASKIRDDATALTLLNHLNLALEPCFSFKGGVGLAHGLIFRMMKRLSLPPLLASEITRKKWNLLKPIDQSSSWGVIA